MPAKVTEQEFKEFLDLNTINYVKTEKLTSKKDGRVEELFKLEIKYDTEGEVLITENLTCPANSQQMWPFKSLTHKFATEKKSTLCCRVFMLLKIT